MRPYRISQPPEAVRGAKLDNVALVPASLLPFKQQWQAVANSLPDGSILICLPPSGSPQRKALETVAGLLRADGYQVTTMSAERFPLAGQLSMPVS